VRSSDIARWERDSGIDRGCSPHYLIGFVLLFCLLNLGVQFLIFHRALNDSPLSVLAPGQTDAQQYWNKAELWRREGFAAAFRDGARLPGYTAFLVLCGGPLGARVVQMFLAAMLPLLMFLALRRTGERTAFLAAALTSVWPPLYAMTTVLYAETLSLVLLALLLICLEMDLRWPWLAILCGVLVAALTYLKPNHAPLVLLGLTARNARMRTAVVACGVTMALLAPWMAWLGTTWGTWPPLATVQGYNLYQGAGYVAPTAATVSRSVMDHFALYDSGRDQELRSSCERENPVLESKCFQQIAIHRWQERPLALTVLGASRILHSFGFSLRNKADFILAAFSMAAFITAIVAFFSFPAWAERFWICVLILSAQAFFIMGDERFKSTIVDLPSIAVIAIAASMLLSRFQRPGRPKSAELSGRGIDSTEAQQNSQLL
jgi:hypothetical protein